MIKVLHLEYLIKKFLQKMIKINFKFKIIQKSSLLFKIIKTILIQKNQKYKFINNLNMYFYNIRVYLENIKYNVHKHMKSMEIG